LTQNEMKKKQLTLHDTSYIIGIDSSKYILDDIIVLMNQSDIAVPDQLINGDRTLVVLSFSYIKTTFSMKINNICIQITETQMIAFLLYAMYYDIARCYDQYGEY